MFVRVLYSIFLGILVALFVGWAMSSWFPTPQWDTEYPGVQQYPSPPVAPTSDELSYLDAQQKDARVQQYKTDLANYQKWQADHDQMDKDFKAKVDKQGTTVALISLLIAVVVTTASLLYSGKLDVIAEGLLLGGIFTLIYSIGWSFTHAPKYAVLTVGISLIVTLAVGYVKFAKKAPAPHESA